jgi:hypothetical protein
VASLTPLWSPAVFGMSHLIFKGVGSAIDAVSNLAAEKEVGKPLIGESGYEFLDKVVNDKEKAKTFNDDSSIRFGGHENAFVDEDLDMLKKIVTIYMTAKNMSTFDEQMSHENRRLKKKVKITPEHILEVMNMLQTYRKEVEKMHRVEDLETLKDLPNWTVKRIRNKDIKIEKIGFEFDIIEFLEYDGVMWAMNNMHIFEDEYCKLVYRRLHSAFKGKDGAAKAIRHKLYKGWGEVLKQEKEMSSSKPQSKRFDVEKAQAEAEKAMQQKVVELLKNKGETGADSDSQKKVHRLFPLVPAKPDQNAQTESNQEREAGEFQTRYDTPALNTMRYTSSIELNRDEQQADVIVNGAPDAATAASNITGSSASGEPTSPTAAAAA